MLGSASPCAMRIDSVHRPIMRVQAVRGRIGRVAAALFLARAAFIAKPYRKPGLARSIRTLLDDKPVVIA